MQHGHFVLANYTMRPTLVTARAFFTRSYSLGVLIEMIYSQSRVLPNATFPLTMYGRASNARCVTPERPNFGVESDSNSRVIALWRPYLLVTFVSQSSAIPQALSSKLFHLRI